MRGLYAFGSNGVWQYHRSKCSLAHVFMDIDRLLSIHQSHSLLKIGAINKQMLIAQYAQCEQISALQKEISTSNSISRQILENQLKEIKHQEFLRYYKSLAYAMKEAVGCIEAEKDIVFKCFLYELYSEPIINNTREAKSNLEEISDKEYCNGIETTMQAIGNTYSLYKNEYKKSNFSHLLESQSSYQEQQNVLVRKRRAFFMRKFEIEKELSAIRPKPMKSVNRGCGIKVLFILSILGLYLMIVSVFTDISVLPILFILFFLPFIIPLIKLIKRDKRWKENYSEYINDLEAKKKALYEKLNVINLEIEKEENLLKTSQYAQTKNAISLTYPHWEDSMSKIDSYIPKIEISESQKKRRQKDLYEAAKCLIKAQTVSVAIIQRHFSCSCNKANEYLNKLLEVDIVKDNKIQIQSEEELNGYWEIIKDALI